MYWDTNDQKNEMVVFTEEDIFMLLLNFGEETSIITMREILGVNQSSPKNNTLKNILRQYTHLNKLCMFTCLQKIKIVDTNFGDILVTQKYPLNSTPPSPP